MEDPQIAALKRRTIYLLIMCIGLLICSVCALGVAHMHGDRLTGQMSLIMDQRARMEVQRARIELLESRVDALKARMDTQGDI